MESPARCYFCKHSYPVNADPWQIMYTGPNGIWRCRVCNWIVGGHILISNAEW